MNIVFVTGGVRSGKSLFAEITIEKLASGSMISYIATMPYTEDMEDRISAHRNRRAKNFETLEQNSDFINAPLQKNVLLECIHGIVISKMFTDEVFEAPHPDKVAEDVINELKPLFLRQDIDNLVIVSGEVGLGLMSASEISNKFADIVGKVNRWIATQSQDVYLVVAGIEVKIK